MAHRVRENDLARANQYSQLMVRLVHEGRAPSRHFVHEDAESPPIDREPVALHIQNLGRQVLSSATEAVCLIFGLLQKLCQTEVRQPNVTIRVHQHVLWLQVSVHDLFGVQIAEGHQDLRADKFNCLLVESLHLVQVVVDVAARDILQEEVDPQLIRKHVVHRVDKGMVRVK